MNPERWQQVKTLFHQALERDPLERAAFLAGHCAGDPELRKEIESLLNMHENGGDLLETPAGDLGARLLKEQAPASMVGEHVGPYRLLREVGWGGMGTIYEAVRDDDAFRKRVAIKIVRREVASQLVLSRFRHERQILADLDHPHIAALYDGGVTRDGRPYFAMEYVEGQPINEYAVRLPVRERVALFMRVCEAVQYAHRNLVVHRDLKPGNILVTASGQPKLLDFGIAKLLAQGEGEAGSQLTCAGDLLLTPDYASPEQVRGGPVTTAVDVYSLGVILYELLVGHRPYRLDGRPLQEIVRVITESDPVCPSAAIGANEALASADGGVAHLRRRLAGDLDAIVLKAIRKEPGQRYGSVEQLREDLQRFLDGHPVLARSGSELYRLRKFIRRHAAGVATIALLMMTLAGGIVATLTQARRAEAERARAQERFDDLRGLTNSVLFEINDSIAELPGATPVRSLLVKRGVEYLDRLSRQASGDPSLEREVAAAYLQLGAVQGSPTAANLGDLEGARASCQHALAIAQRLLAANPNDREARRTLALAHERLTDVEAWAGDVPAGVRHAREALAAWRVLSEGRTTEAEGVLPLAVSHIKLGDVLGNPVFPNRGDHSGALAAYQSALRMLEALPAQEHGDVRVRRYVALLHERIGEMHLSGQRYREARDSFGQSLGIREALASANEMNRNMLRDLGVAHEKICNVHLAQGDGRGALPECLKAVSLYQRLYSADPRDTQAIATLALGHRWVHHALAAAGDLPAALVELERSTELLRNLRELQADGASARRTYAHNLLYSSRLQHRLSREPGIGARGAQAHRRRAVADLEQAREMLKRLQEEGVGTAEDEKLLRETAAELGEPATP
jgi:serine/threonine protein kinase